MPLIFYFPFIVWMGMMKVVQDDMVKVVQDEMRVPQPRHRSRSRQPKNDATRQRSCQHHRGCDRKTNSTICDARHSQPCQIPAGYLREGPSLTFSPARQLKVPNHPSAGRGTAPVALSHL